MAITDSQKVDLLYKKLFGVAKTDTSTNKSASNEAIASPALLRRDKLWTQSSSIPDVAAAVTGLIEEYTGTSSIECTADTTSLPVSGIYPTWKTNIINWIPPEFGASYFVKVYVDFAGVADPTATGTQIFDAGSSGIGEWFFDYQAGVLNFIGTSIPTILTSNKKIYVSGYKYVGTEGIQAGVLNTSADLDISSLTDGSILVWNENTQKWTSTTILSKQTIEGGINDAGFF